MTGDQSRLLKPLALANTRDAVKASFRNEYLESEVCELMQAVSHPIREEGSRLTRGEYHGRNYLLRGVAFLVH
jgi:hypothetical protein